MQSEIDDQLIEMDYPEETKKVLRSGLMYGTGVMKGPMISKRQKRLWEPLEDGDYQESVEQEELPFMKHVRIWDWYPDMSVTELDKIEGSFERHCMTKHDIRQLMKRDDFYQDMIAQHLKEHPDGDYVPRNWETDLQVIETEAGSGKAGQASASYPTSPLEDAGSTSRQMGKKYQVLEYWGYVDGSDLLACGVNVDDVTLEYAANVWLLGHKPIKAVLYDGALNQYKVFYYEKDETSLMGEGLARVMRHSQLAIAAGARMVLDNGAAVCLSGDTMVYKRKKEPIAIRDLHNKRKRRERTVIRSVNEETGEMFYNRVLDVVCNGTKPVYELCTLNGYKIKVTQDHLFMCDDGTWRELQRFNIGDLIAVNGTHKRPAGVCCDCGAITKGSGIRCRSCAMKLTHPPDIDLPKECIECGKPTATRGVRCKKCAAKLENNSWNRKQAEDAINNDEANDGTARARWSCQKDKKDHCEQCGISGKTGIRLDIHHKDRNPHNNDPLNKITLCSTCHLFDHRRHDYFGNPRRHTFVDYDEIVSISYKGTEEVYDIKMEGPNHNFVANGVISHNCGPQVEVNWSLMVPGADFNSFYPRKIWYREGKGIDAQYPALRVYNIDSHIDELIKIIELFKSFGDEETTLPTWMIGQMVNNETAQATSGRMATITVSIKDIAKNFDTFTEKVMRDLYAWNMDFNPRTDIKGDYSVKARGVSSLVMKEIRMQALSQLNTTLTPEQKDYIPEGEFVSEMFKAHDLKINLRTDEEVKQIREARKQNVENQLALEMLRAEIGYKKSQTMAQLTKAKEHNISALKDAQTPPETIPADDPRLAEADLAQKETDRVATEAQIRRDEERHMMEMAHADETHTVRKAIDTTKAASEIALKGKKTEAEIKTKAEVAKAKAKQSKTKTVKKEGDK